MARTEIPVRRMVQCDRCGTKKQDRLDPRDPQLILKKHALDYQGCAVADGTEKWDLCGTCWDRLLERLRAFFAETDFETPQPDEGGGDG